MTRHEHYEAIVAFAEGKKIELQNEYSGAWFLWTSPAAPAFSPEVGYRVRDEYRELKEAFARGEKIEAYQGRSGTWEHRPRPTWVHIKGPAGYRIAPKPDTSETRAVYLRGEPVRIRFTFDGTTGAVKHVEIIK